MKRIKFTTSSLDASTEIDPVRVKNELVLLFLSMARELGRVEGGIGLPVDGTICTEEELWDKRVALEITFQEVDDGRTT